jgi:hypothetical protein
VRLFWCETDQLYESMIPCWSGFFSPLSKNIIRNAVSHIGYHHPGVLFPYLFITWFFFLSFFLSSVNYLSHFLLTESLLEKTTFLENSNYPRIVHVTSTFHFAVDGSDLRPPMLSQLVAAATKKGRDSGKDPIASQPGGNHGFVFMRSQRQYANSKLAQILHARYYQRKYPNLDSVTACPAWVGTQIIRAQQDGILARIFRFMAYPANGYGLSSILRAMFVDTHKEDQINNNNNNNINDFFINNKLMHGARYVDHFLNGIPLLSKLTYQWLPIRDVMLFGSAMLVLHWQRVFTWVEPAQSSEVSYDVQLQDDLYQWSRQAVQEWL